MATTFSEGPSRVHMIGIGGAGMSGLARILRERGVPVSGSDVVDGPILDGLRESGARIAVGHARENLRLTGNLPSVVVTSFKAIPEDNPELVEAKRLGIPIIHRSDLLAALMEGHRQLLIAGTHGKTSTTSMAVVAAQAAGLDPSFAIGGQLTREGEGSHAGGGSLFIAEADESDASLLSYRPDIAVVTTVEPDHLDFFGTPNAYYEVFEKFADLVQGHLVVSLDDDRAAGLGARAVDRGIAVVGYGDIAACSADPRLPRLTTIGDTVVTPDGTRATMTIDGTSVEVMVRVPGRHMVHNAAAALTAGYLAGGDPRRLAEGLSSFGGVRRRFEPKGEARGVRVFDDYAHHPTEVRASISAARDIAGSGRVIAVFQPHLYSRTQRFAHEFAEALSGADEVVLMEVYGARERPLEGVSSRLIGPRVLPDADVPAAVAGLARRGDVILTIGAGSVTKQGPLIVEVLEGR